MNKIFMEVPVYGRLDATWEHEGRMIVVRYGPHVRRAVASEDDKANKVIAVDVLRSIVAEELKD